VNKLTNEPQPRAQPEDTNDDYPGLETIEVKIASIGNKPSQGSLGTWTQCPQCHRIYIPDLPRGEGKAYQREQHISGLCSDECWNLFLGMDDLPDTKVLDTDEEMGVSKSDRVLEPYYGEEDEGNCELMSIYYGDKGNSWMDVHDANASIFPDPKEVKE